MAHINYINIEKYVRKMEKKKGILVLLLLFCLVFLPAVSAVYCDIEGCVYHEDGSNADASEVSFVNVTLNKSGTLHSYLATVVNTGLPFLCNNKAKYATSFNDFQCGSSGYPVSIWGGKCNC